MTACGSGANDGTQTYDDALALGNDLAEHDIFCFYRNTEADEPGIQQGECMSRGHYWTIRVWGSPEERDRGTADLANVLAATGEDDCLVVGRGDGAWSVHVVDAPDLCQEIATALGVTPTSVG